MDDMDGINEARTADRFNRREHKRWKRDGFGATEEFASWAKDPVQRLAQDIPARLQRRTKLNLLLQELDPLELALVMVASLTDSILRGRSGLDQIIDLGSAVQGLAFETKVLRPEKMGRRGRRKAIAAMEVGYRSNEWSVRDVSKAGNQLRDICLTALPDVYECFRGSDGALAARVTEEWETKGRELREQLIWAHPVLRPCEFSPKRWTSWRNGGYQEERTRTSVAFVSGAAAHHPEIKRLFKTAFRTGTMKQHIDAVSSQQDVPLRINEPVLDAVKKYAPDFLEDKFRAKHQRLLDKRARMQAANASHMWVINRDIKACEDQHPKDKQQLELDIADAEYLKVGRFSGGTRFYVPLHCDFRGRLNAVPHFHYQREDHIRSLYLFDRGMPIGDNEKYLKDLAASRWGEGLDKKTLPERREWCDENWDLIESTAKLDSEHWLKAKKPFAFLAACIELVEARKVGPGFITRLPIFFDGTCNGLQHFCALTRSDPLGLMAEYGTATPAVDTYGRLAKHIGRYQHINIDRDLVKMPVSTFFYGAGTIRMADQIREVLEERGVPFPDDPSEAGVFFCGMAKEVERAIEKLIPGAKETMEFLKRLAGALAREGKMLQYTTPSGLPWLNLNEESVDTTVSSKLLGARVRWTVREYQRKIDADGARRAAAPNFVHALDAAHLVRTVNACVASGIRDILTIHDCYACLAPQATQFNKIIRDEFVRMYEEHDPLTEIRECAKRILRAGDKLQDKANRVAAASGFETPGWCPVPKRGDLDLRTFAANVYAFSS